MKKNIDFIENYINNDYWTNWLGISRTLLAFSTLLTIIFNDFNSLYYTGLLNENSLINGKLNLSIYTWVSNIEYAHWITIVVLIITIIGLYPRLFCLFHWLVTYSFFHSSTISDGGDHIASIITFLLIPICLLDKRNSHWSTKNYSHNFYEKCVATISYELIKFQIFIIYFFASIGKLSHKVWQEGTALYYWLTEPLFGPSDWLFKILEPLIKNPIILTLTTWFVLILELFIAFSYFSKNNKIKIYTLYIGVFFHFLIAICFGLISFFLVMTACLIVYLNLKNENFKFKNMPLIYYRFTNLYFKLKIYNLIRI